MLGSSFVDTSLSLANATTPVPGIYPDEVGTYRSGGVTR